MAAKDTTAFLRFTTGNQKERDGGTWMKRGRRRGWVHLEIRKANRTIRLSLYPELSPWNLSRGYSGNVVIILWNVSSGWTLVCVVSDIKENNHHVT